MCHWWLLKDCAENILRWNKKNTPIFIHYSGNVSDAACSGGVVLTSGITMYTPGGTCSLYDNNDRCVWNFNVTKNSVMDEPVRKIKNYSKSSLNEAWMNTSWPSLTILSWLVSFSFHIINLWTMINLKQFLSDHLCLSCKASEVSINCTKLATLGIKACMRKNRINSPPFHFFWIGLFLEWLYALKDLDRQPNVNPGSWIQSPLEFFFLNLFRSSPSKPLLAMLPTSYHLGKLRKAYSSCTVSDTNNNFRSYYLWICFVIKQSWQYENNWHEEKAFDVNNANNTKNLE